MTKNPFTFILTTFLWFVSLGSHAGSFKSDRLNFQATAVFFSSSSGDIHLCHALSKNLPNQYFSFEEFSEEEERKSIKESCSSLSNSSESLLKTAFYISKIDYLTESQHIYNIPVISKNRYLFFEVFRI
jgi:hypothetical protein